MCKESPNIGRELTLEEEILNLDIDKTTKDRILYKLSNLLEDLKSQDRYLTNCHRRIDELERAIVETTVTAAKNLDCLREEREDEIRRCIEDRRYAQYRW